MRLEIQSWISDKPRHKVLCLQPGQPLHKEYIVLQAGDRGIAFDDVCQRG